MSTPNCLRRIALSVDEPDPGEFYWTLMESTNDISVWIELDAAPESKKTYQAALREGLRVLEQYSDGDIGPRTAGKDKNASRAG